MALRFRDLNLSHGVKEKDSLAPSSVDLLPLHRASGSFAEPEAADRPKGPIARDVEQAVQHVGGLQILQLVLRTFNLQDQRNIVKRSAKKCHNVKDCSHQAPCVLRCRPGLPLE